MSYDISFYKRKEATLSKGEVFTYLEEKGLKKNGPESRSYHYENERTGVYFIMDDAAMLKEEDEAQILENAHFKVERGALR